MQVVLALGLVLAVVMIVGHCLWLIVAAFFRAIFADELDRPATHLPGAPKIAPPLTRAAELEITSRQIARLCADEKLAPEQCEPVLAAIHAELAQLRPHYQASAAVRQATERVAVPTVDAELFPQPAAMAIDVVDAELVEFQARTATAPEPVVPQPLHPLDRPIVAPPPSQPARPGRTLADMLQSFMEESNIRWGEILAAALIVLCSVGLVVSLRNTLKNIPYFPAILFTLFTVAFHSAGLYTVRRWKLQAVSRVILIISLLLVPLTFCGSVVLQQTRDMHDPLFLAAITIGAAVFGWVTYSASRELAPNHAGPLAFGVLAPSMAQTLIQRLNLADGDWWQLHAAAAVPIAGFLTATLSIYRTRHIQIRLTKPQIAELLRVLAIAGFALLVPLALILVRGSSLTKSIAHLSPELSLAAAASLGNGLLVHLRTKSHRLAAWQAAGTAIVVLGAVLLLLLVAATWPDPELLLIVGLLNCCSLAALGILGQIPLLYVPSVLCAALAATIGWHLAAGHLADREALALHVVQAAVRGQTSIVLMVIGAILTGLAAWRSKRGQQEEGQMLLVSAGWLAVASLLIALFSGFIVVPHWPQDTELAALVLFAFAAGLIASGSIFQRRDLTACGSFVLWLSFIQALAMNPVARGWFASDSLLRTRPILLATLAHGIVTALAALIAGIKTIVAGRADFRIHQTAPRNQYLAEPLAIGAAASLAAAALFIAGLRNTPLTTAAYLSLIAAGGWCLLAACQRWQWAISGLQLMLAAAAALFVAGKWQGTLETGQWLIASDHLLAQCTAVAIAAIGWAIVRRLIYQREPLRQLLNAPWPSVDQILLAATTIGLPIIAMFATIPHVRAELGFGELASATAHPPTADFGSSNAWFALAMAITALFASLCERVTFPACAGLPLVSFAAVWFVAQIFAPDIAAASAVRWAAAVYAICWATAYLARQKIESFTQRFKIIRWDSFPRDAANWFGAQPLVVGGVTILIITIVAVQQQLGGDALGGPLADTVFARLGPTISYLVPLLALVGVLLAYAIREKHAAFALGGSAIWQLAANLSFLIAFTNVPPGDVRVVSWLQWNSIAAGSFALIWLSLSRWITPPQADDSKRQLAKGLWSIPLAVAGTTAAALSLWTAAAISHSPANPPLVLATLGAWQSYLSVALVLVAIVSRWPIRGNLDITINAATGVAAALVPPIAASVHKLIPADSWLPYHALESGWLLVGTFGCVFLCWPGKQSLAPSTASRPHHLSIAAITALATLLAIAGNGRDPAQPWWSLGVVAGAALIGAALALNRRSQPYAYASTILSGVAATLFVCSPVMQPVLGLAFGADLDAVEFELVILTLILASGFWLWTEIESQRRRGQSFDELWPLPRVHILAAISIMPIYFLYGLASAILAPWFDHVPATQVVSTVTVTAVGSLIAALLWDHKTRLAAPILYCWLGIVWLLLISVASPLLRAWLPTPWEYNAAAHTVLFVAALALQVALTGHFWSYGANLAAWGSKLGIIDPVGGLPRIAHWLPVANSVLTAIVCTAGCLLVLVIDHGEFPFRVAAALLPAIAAWGIAGLAQERRREAFQLAALLLAGFTAILLAWAQIEPNHTTTAWLERVLRLLMVLAALTFAYGLALPRLLFTEGTWNAVTRKAGYLAAISALAAFAVTLGLEAALFVPGIGVSIPDTQVAAIAAILLVFIAGLVSLAVLPGRDPLLLSEHGRQVYVYAAELTLALVFAHVYLCRPFWFDGLLRPYWPFIVLGLAFVGVGAAELFTRFGIRVLAEPLTRTGALLPLLPALGMWIVGAEVDYTLVLFAAGLLYAVVSYSQQSWLAAAAAALAGNGALWSLWHEQEMAFLANPQLWLIPPALSVLVAAQLNRRRLPADLLAAIRYGATLVLYVSSTGEIISRGFAGGLLPPMILLGLAVAGALGGIALRVRAFLILGSSFTFVALMAMVRHAAQSIEHVWPWWVFGITLGVAILFLFGLFEKKRTDVLLLIGRLRQWEY